MRPGPRMVTVAAVLLTVAAMAACGLVPDGPEAVSVTPPPSVAEPPAVVAPPVATERPPLSPAVEVPLAPVPTVHGPYVPPTPQPDASATPAPSAMPSPSATAGPTPAPGPGPADLLARLPVARELSPLTWATEKGERTAAWSQVSAAAATAPATAIVHLGAARASGGACAAAADAVDRAALAAAMVSLAADPAPGAPFDLVLVRYPTPAAAERAMAALQGLGNTCAGVETDAGVLEAGESAHGPTAVLRADDAVLIAEATVIDAMLAVVLHEGAPPEAVATLLAAPR